MLLLLDLFLEVVDSAEGVVLVGPEEGAVRADLLLFSQADYVHHHIVLRTDVSSGCRRQTGGLLK